MLIVDDNDFTRKIVLRVLKDLGFTGTTDTDSAESAIKLFEGNSFDLIITDVHMPEMNGLDFVQQIRTGKTHAKPDTRIIVLTSFSQTEILGTALALDVNGFLVKPIIPAVADEKLAQALTEPLRLHPPLAYEAIKVELRSLPDSDCQTMPGKRGNTPGKHYLRSGGKIEKATHHTIRNLRPTMILSEDIYLSDGSLLMSSGHTLSQLSINRLNDLRELIPEDSIAVYE